MTQDNDETLQQFYQDIKTIESRDAVLKPKDQIDRLNRPGNKFFNLNPYEVLMIDPDTPMKDIKKRWKALELLTHPDRNLDDTVRAKHANEVIRKAWNTLNSLEGIKKCEEIIDEAKIAVNKIMEDKRFNLLKNKSQTLEIDEDDPMVYKTAVHKQACKIFAQLELLREEEERKKRNTLKRKREQEDEEKMLREQREEMAKQYESNRESRVSDWRKFSKKAKISKFKSAQPKMEMRKK